MGRIELSSQPLISVLVSTFNRAQELPRAIESVQAQTYTHWQLILSDDGSIDDTFEQIRPFLKDERILYFYHPNVKLAQSRNLGFKLADGDWIAILDSDDTYAPEHLEQNLKFVLKNKIDLSAGRVIFHGTPEQAFVPDRFDPRKKIHVDECVLSGTLFFHRKVFEDVKGFPIIPYSEDAAFWQLAEESGFKTGRNPNPSYHYFAGSSGSLVDAYRLSIESKK